MNLFNWFTLVGFAGMLYLHFIKPWWVKRNLDLNSFDTSMSCEEMLTWLTNNIVQRDSLISIPLETSHGEMFLVCDILSEEELDKLENSLTNRDTVH